MRQANNVLLESSFGGGEGTHHEGCMCKDSIALLETGDGATDIENLAGDIVADDGRILEGEDAHSLRCPVHE
jgi:hypothetical protein